MGSVAASGGYWIATAGDIIFAEPSTITGSIGVFGILPSFEGTLQRLGVGADGVRTTPLSGEPDLLRGPSPEADRLLQMGVEATYRRFVALVARARRLARRAVDEIGQGRVWDGGTARQLGLVDRFGSLDDAVAEAARRANLDPGEARTVYLEDGPDFWSSLLNGLFAGGGQRARRRATSSPDWRAAPRRCSSARSTTPSGSPPARRSRRAASNARPPPRSAAHARRKALWARLLAALWRG